MKKKYHLLLEMQNLRRKQEKLIILFPVIKHNGELWLGSNKSNQLLKYKLNTFVYNNFDYMPK